MTAAIDSLTSNVDSLKVAAGQDVFQQGEPGDRFYVIEGGQAEVISDGWLIPTLEPGDRSGEIGRLGRAAMVRARARMNRPVRHP